MTINRLMRRGEISARHALLLKTREDSHYSATRGVTDRHCGATNHWPHGDCRHFVGPNACTEVGGVIALRGLCDWWKSTKGD
jgi:hypothetical protein